MSCPNIIYDKNHGKNFFFYGMRGVYIFTYSNLCSGNKNHTGFISIIAQLFLLFFPCSIHYDS